jgi:hypothetical protein
MRFPRDGKAHLRRHRAVHRGDRRAFRGLESGGGRNDVHRPGGARGWKTAVNAGLTAKAGLRWIRAAKSQLQRWKDSEPDSQQADATGNVDRRFTRARDGPIEASLAAETDVCGGEESRLKAGCSQDWLPHLLLFLGDRGCAGCYLQVLDLLLVDGHRQHEGGRVAERLGDAGKGDHSAFRFAG